MVVGRNLLEDMMVMSGLERRETDPEHSGRWGRSTRVWWTDMEIEYQERVERVADGTM